MQNVPTTPPSDHRDSPVAPAYAWATWSLTLLLIGLWLIGRLIYLRWFCVYELFGDEANYWECARRLQLSYHYSGPGVVAVVAAAVRLFGDVAWGMRFPAAISMALTAGLIGHLANRISGDQRAGFFSAVIFLLFPSTVLWSQVITYDPLYTTCWMAATWCAWVLIQRHRRGEGVMGWWAALGFALGVGVLFKYSAILLAPGLLVYAILQRRTIRWDTRLLLGALVCAVVFLLAISPILIWNQQEGWPTITYLRGHMNRPTDSFQGAFEPLWIPRFFLAQLGLVGPPVMVLLVAAMAAAWRGRRDRPQLWDHQLLLLGSGGSIIVFFFLTNFMSKTHANWTLAGYAPLAILIGLHTARRLPHLSRLYRRSWGWALALGLLALTIAWAPLPVSRLPVVGRFVPLERFRGAQELAEHVDQLRAELRQHAGHEPLIIARTYLVGSQIAFYAPDHPTIYCAASYMGWRRNTYDFWDDTNMKDPALVGRPAILVGSDLPTWHKAIVVRDVRTISLKPMPVFVAMKYEGVRPEVRQRGGPLR